MSCTGILANSDREPCPAQGGCNGYFGLLEQEELRIHVCIIFEQTVEEIEQHIYMSATSVLLENDDTDGHGPETRFVKNVGQCDGNMSN